MGRPAAPGSWQLLGCAAGAVVHRRRQLGDHVRSLRGGATGMSTDRKHDDGMADAGGDLKQLTSGSSVPAAVLSSPLHHWPTRPPTGEQRRSRALCPTLALLPRPLPCCYQAAAMLLPGRCQAAARPLPGCCQAAAGPLPGCCRAAARLLPGSCPAPPLTLSTLSSSSPPVTSTCSSSFSEGSSFDSFLLRPSFTLPRPLMAIRHPVSCSTQSQHSHSRVTTQSRHSHNTATARFTEQSNPHKRRQQSMVHTQHNHTLTRQQSRVMYTHTTQPRPEKPNGSSLATEPSTFRTHRVSTGTTLTRSMRFWVLPRGPMIRPMKLYPG